MKTKTVYGKELHPAALPAPMVIYLPDDYNLPCYRIMIAADGYASAERCSYYADVLVNDAMQIQKVERYKDNYMVNAPVTAFPPALEAVFEQVIQKAIS